MRWIVWLPDKELAREEVAASEGFSYAGAKPTDDYHEELATRLGRPLTPPGRDVRCIVSVGMLTEGCWSVVGVAGGDTAGKGEG
jgi:hypothetical protein